MQKAFSVVALLAVVSGCASHQTAGGGGASQSQAPAPANRNRDIITKEELSTPTISILSVLDAVKTLRPHFLTVRGLTSVPAKDDKGNQLVDEEAGKVHVSIDGGRLISLDELSGIRAGTIAEVRYLSPAAAMQKFGGIAREGPVIVVTTIK